MSPLSSSFLNVLAPALRRARHFAPVEKVAYPTKSRLVIIFRSRIQPDPSISSVARAIMITTANSSVRRSGGPNHYVGDLLHTVAISRLSRSTAEAPIERRYLPGLTLKSGDTRFAGPQLTRIDCKESCQGRRQNPLACVEFNLPVSLRAFFQFLRPGRLVGARDGAG